MQHRRVVPSPWADLTLLAAIAALLYVSAARADLTVIDPTGRRWAAETVTYDVGKRELRWTQPDRIFVNGFEWGVSP